MAPSPTFVTHSLLPTFVQHSPLTARRTRHQKATTPIAARSMESYRSGRRFTPREEHKRLPMPPPRPSKSTKPSTSPTLSSSSPSPTTTTPKSKSHTSLLRALVALNVASSETCAFLVRNGRIRVNGTTVTDATTRIDRQNDRLLLNGRDLGTAASAAPIPDADDDRMQREPRTHRDRTLTDVDSMRYGYVRGGVDGGFFASKRRKYGK